eukprot:CAMPEP_0172636412 /NCGR_PEP_ID=MMETSP1068-20121228/203847_1 /TAXON_ID=35684 /ORGANISM="Pseudopedinella elastica, Strain CCMP716" /LENGTH=433 /DNA_ID=CAMNT_0013448825 /DNA_START=451 /DNA_END=1753 /DNA_ORIENTATION=-
MLGDSLAGGAGCNDGVHTPKACSYPQRFARRLADELHWERDQVELYNLAAGGTPTQAVLATVAVTLRRLASLSNCTSTLLLLDHSDNDSIFARRGHGRVRAAVESLIRFCLTEHSGVAILLVENLGFPTKHGLPSDLPEAYKVAEYYGVPHVRTRQVLVDWGAAWSEGCSPEKCCFAKCQGHPGWPAHVFIGHILLASVIALGRELGCGAPPPLPVGSPALPPPMSDSALLASLPVCREPTSSYEARAAVGHGAPGSLEGVRATSGNWTLFEDRPGKPGWISDTKGSAIDFALHFGKDPWVTFAFVVGYDPPLSRGRVEIRIKPAQEMDGKGGKERHPNKLLVTASRSDGARFTQTMALPLHVRESLVGQWEAKGDNYEMGNAHAKGSTDVFGFNVHPNSAATMSVKLVCDAANLKSSRSPHVDANRLRSLVY